MTYTVATLAVPPAVFDLLKETMEELGQHHRFMNTPGEDGKPEQAIDFSGVAIVSGVEDCRDDFINSGKLSDLLVQSNEEAFRSGYEAGADHALSQGHAGNYYPAWGFYTPSDDIMALQADLSKETF